MFELFSLLCESVYLLISHNLEVSPGFIFSKKIIDKITFVKNVILLF